MSIQARIEDELGCEVLVIGGGIAGICAAIAAARNGCDTALIESDPLLGGNGSPLLGVHVSGAHSFHPHAGETGVIEEIELEAAYQGAKTRTPGNHYNLSTQWDLVLEQKLAESGVRVFRQHQGRRAIVQGRRIVGVIVEDSDHFRTRMFRVGHGIIEASGDGVVAADAGAEFMYGTEGRDVFGERSAYDQSVGDTMGTSLTALICRRKDPVTFKLPPAYAARLAAQGGHKQLAASQSWWFPQDADVNFVWVTEAGGVDRNTLSQHAEIRQEVLYQLYGWWDNVKNFSFVDQARHWDLLWVSPKTGKRESRRFVGDVVLTQTDVESARTFDDDIGYGGYGLDIHDMRKNRVIFYCIPPLWNFPYRASYSRSFDNLWLAGRLMSVSHLALGTVRLMRTLAGIAQGVGTAAALARSLKCTAGEIYTHHRKLLQQTVLEQDGTILSAVNEDPADLARSCHVSASSEMIHGATRVQGYLPLDVPRGVQLWDWAPTLRGMEVAVRNTTDRPLPLGLTVSVFHRSQLWKEDSELIGPQHIRTAGNRMEWGTDNAIARFEQVARATAVAPPRYEGWVAVELPSPLKMVSKNPTSDEDRYNLLLDAQPGLEVGVDPHEYDFAIRLAQPAGADRYEVAANCHAFRLDPSPPYGQASNIIDGHNRRYSTNPVHMWLSDFDLPLPQDVTLELPHARRLGRVQVTFDTLDRAYQDTPINSDRRVDGRCVRDYRLEALVGTQWRTLAEVTGNYQRRRVHSFEPVAALAVRLTVLAMNDARWPARVYEIRCYQGG